VQGATFAILETLSHRPYQHWRRKPFGLLKGPACLGLGEIRIEEPKASHHRILGFFHDPDFILLLAFAKDTDPAYAKACPDAQTRRLALEQDRAVTEAWRFSRVRFG